MTHVATALARTPVHDAARPSMRKVAIAALWLIVVVLLAVLTVCMLVPRATGATPYTVLTGSMSPAIDPGTVVVVRATPFEEIAVGDVVTYQLRSEDPTTVTHRVVGVTWSRSLGRLLTMQGDANGAPDQQPVRAVQVRGTVWYQVPWIGHVVRYGDPALRATLATVLGWSLIAYAVVVLLRGGRPMRSRRAER